MKPQSILSAALFTAIVAFAVGAQAASDTDKAAEGKDPVAGAQAPAASVQAEKKVRPHSHLEEKTGVPQKAPEPQLNKPNSAKDMSKHYHPRDMK
ncbi:conserved exported hypothetical protein [Candidatus Accumulibacter aalborgensis]|uniref:Uncharacterized protein n=1 Tax=Candidatus Accumulibacter aalborgensis TaxID=1860102 RepID=A0A1A8XW49_9PROT|nr:hypothetical protein [Candidatus Accumulibacter aalborgensis]SBT09240.1 conserved exported hypothetical protein [Candidatus Accumulibacter aalborgensis]